MPLEALVERRPHAARRSRTMRACCRSPSKPGCISCGCSSGSRCRRSYRSAFIAQFALQAPPTPARADALDDARARFVQTMAGRAPDARLLAASLRAPAAAARCANAALNIAPGDRAEVQQTATAWLAWYDALFTRAARAGGTMRGCRRGWSTRCRSPAACPQHPATSVTLTATEFDGGRLDWSSFDVNAEVNIGTDRRPALHSRSRDDHAGAGDVPRCAGAAVLGDGGRRASPTACCRSVPPTSRT